MPSGARRAIHLILDWDGTLACKDTLHLVAKIGYDKRGLPLNGPGEYPPPATSWAAVGDKYLEEYNKHKLSYRPHAVDRSTLSEERQWLASLKPIETFGAKTAERTQVFRGVTVADVQRTATTAVNEQQISLRSGWIELVNHVLADGKLSILSVNWSKCFIRAAMLAILDKPGGISWNQKLCAYVRDTLRINNANEIQGVGDKGGSSGRLRSDDDTKDIRTSADKMLHMPQRCQQNGAGNRSTQNSDDNMVVYCGDSDIDLECLLSADVGVCLQDDPRSSGQKALATTLERLRIPVHPIEEFTYSGEKGPRLWAAQDFHQVLQALKRIGTDREMVWTKATLH